MLLNVVHAVYVHHMAHQQIVGNVPDWTLADRLRKAREVAGLNTIELASELGISRHSISNYERGKYAPSRPVVQVWALRTGVDLEWLTYGRTVTREGVDGQAPEQPAGATGG